MLVKDIAYIVEDKNKDGINHIYKDQDIIYSKDEDYLDNKKHFVVL